MDKQIVVYKTADDFSLEVQTDGETVWLTQEQMCRLFGRTQPVIARHIANIFREGELTKEVVYAKFAYTTRHGAIDGTDDGRRRTEDLGGTRSAHRRNRLYYVVLSPSSHKLFDSARPFAIFAFSAALKERLPCRNGKQHEQLVKTKLFPALSKTPKLPVAKATKCCG